MDSGRLSRKVEHMAEKILNRAETEQQKREIIERLFLAWCKVPEQRLGQLIDNSHYFHLDEPKSLFSTEDYKLAELVEEFSNDFDRGFRK